jgi:DNA-binding CsgD family transcriptional regulator
MLCDDPIACETLRRVVCGLCPGGPFDEDLMQEGLIRLWTLEEQQPGQSLSWYLQGCRFHLLNQLAAGRSLDARKRERGRLSFCSRADQSWFFDRWEVENAVMPEINAVDIFSILLPRLTAREREVFHYLASGHGTREIARILGVSHQAVTKRRQNIAKVAGELGFLPPGLGSGSLKTKSAGTSRAILDLFFQRKCGCRVAEEAGKTVVRR